ncbi:hypothetical protein C8Q77DRAFT_323942 [Trametes polyzona]|nr:hypothetical protein C8Q77DRAFT_323942 [Trametes polyzona]
MDWSTLNCVLGPFIPAAAAVAAGMPKLCHGGGRSRAAGRELAPGVSAISPPVLFSPSFLPLPLRSFSFAPFHDHTQLLSTLTYIIIGRGSSSSSPHDRTTPDFTQDRIRSHNTSTALHPLD